MSSSYKLKSHPTQSLYDHITGVRDIALKTHKYHTIKPEIDDFIEIVCMWCRQRRESRALFPPADRVYCAPWWVDRLLRSLRSRRPQYPPEHSRGHKRFAGFCGTRRR